MNFYKLYFTCMNLDQLEKLASIVKELKGNFNNKELAQKIGLSDNTIGKWISMKTANPTTESLTALANYMGITLQDLLERIYVQRQDELNTAESFYSLVSRLKDEDKIKLIHFLSSELLNKKIVK